MTFPSNAIILPRQHMITAPSESTREEGAARGSEHAPCGDLSLDLRERRCSQEEVSLNRQGTGNTPL